MEPRAPQERSGRGMESKSIGGAKWPPTRYDGAISCQAILRNVVIIFPDLLDFFDISVSNTCSI